MLSPRYIFQLWVLSFLASHVIAQFSGVYKRGVAIGGWLVAESWMYPLRWQEMGGERCDLNFSTCISSEWGLVHKLGQEKANEVFLGHWKTWFAQEHVDRIKALKLDHVKIPLGFWIIEELLQAPGEMYAQGGWMELKRGLRQLKQAGLNVLLDMHALPGVSSDTELFAGNYTSEVHFYEEANFRRALTWIVILTAMSHLDPDFQRVLGIMFINEPEKDASNTPGLGTYYRDAVTTVRVVEYALGTKCDADLSPALDRMVASHNVIPGLKASIPLLRVYAAKADPPVDVSALTETLEGYYHASETGKAPGYSNTRLNSSTLTNTHQIQHRSRSWRRGIVQYVSSDAKSQQTCLTTVAMPSTWQTGVNPESMAPYVLGPRAFDDHTYFNFGGVANASYDSYMDKICSYDSYERAESRGEVPYGTGEFSIRTNFPDTPSQARDWGDAQKLYYSEHGYWTFWSFRTEDPTDDDQVIKAERWSYLRAVDRGLLTSDPAQYFNASVCKGRENASS